MFIVSFFNNIYFNFNLFQDNLIIRLEINFFIIIFIFVLLIIFLIIIYYSKNYINKNLFYFYFIILINLFLIFIIIIILRKNYYFLFFSWDILGFIRFLLVFFYSIIEVIRSSMITIISNRLGDFTILLWLIISYLIEINEIIFINVLFLVFFIITSMTKRAQFPFLGWLPKAIVAPTPIRALVHRRTLVTRGLFLLINFIRVISYYFNFLIFFIRLIRMFFSSFFGFLEKDLKKLIAWRTLSQISLCFLIFSLNYYFFRFLYLISHAFFKRILFLQVGYIILIKLGEQNLNLYGYNNNFLIIKFNFFYVFFSLCSLFFLRRIFRKDLILEIFFYSFNRIIIILILILIFSITYFYSLKIIIILFKVMNIFIIKIKKDFSFFIINFIFVIFNQYWFLFFIRNFLLIELNFNLEIFSFIYFIFYLILNYRIKLNKNIIIFFIEYKFIIFKSIFFYNFLIEKIILFLFNIFIKKYIFINLNLIKKIIFYFILLYFLFLFIYLY